MHSKACCPLFTWIFLKTKFQFCQQESSRTCLSVLIWNSLTTNCLQSLKVFSQAWNLLSGCAWGGNKISFLHGRAFKDLKSLTRLHIDCSKISVVTNQAFSGLKALENLHLKSNQIASVQLGSFVELNALEVLSFSFNCLLNIKYGMLSGLKSLSLLFLDNNRISTIEADAFSELSSLTDLHLCFNYIKILQTGMFGGLHHLRRLLIHSNQISCVEVGVFQMFPPHRAIELHNNSLTTINPELLKQMKGPTYLSLSLPSGDTNKWNCNSLCWLKQLEKMKQSNANTCSKPWAEYIFIHIVGAKHTGIHFPAQTQVNLVLCTATEHNILSPLVAIVFSSVCSWCCLFPPLFYLYRRNNKSWNLFQNSRNTDDN